MDIWKLQQTACVRVGSAVGRSIYAAGLARKTGTHQEREGVIPRECGPSCDFRLAREVGWPDHGTILPGRWTTPCPTVPAHRDTSTWVNQ